MKPSLDTACVYRAEVMHRRLRPRAYRFRYRVFSLLLDIDALDRCAETSWCFSRNRFNLLSFHDRDHLPPDAHSLRGWAEGVLSDGGIDGSRLRIRLLCFPRVLGRVFNPLSLWYCETAEGEPAAVIAEVRNTFGERHCYLLRPDDVASGWPLRATCGKDFHVSPFIDMHAQYRFRLSRPDDRLRVVIEEYAADGLFLVAAQSGRRRPFTAGVLLHESLRVPLQTFKVLAAIHWHALKLWIAGVRFHPKPQPPVKEVS